VPGNGDWVAWTDDPTNTAPVEGETELFSDGFESGDTSAWPTTVP
jgi:hypothetical protein